MPPPDRSESIDNPPATPDSRQESESLARLLLALFPATLRQMRGSISSRATYTGVSICGLVLLVTPLALWVAWNKFVFVGVLVAAAVAMCVIGVLLWLGPGDQF